MASTWRRLGGSGSWAGRAMSHGFAAVVRDGLAFRERSPLGVDFGRRATAGHPGSLGRRLAKTGLLQASFRVGVLARPERPQGTCDGLAELHFRWLIAGTIEAFA